MEQRDYQQELVEIYKGYEIYKVTTAEGDRHVAYKRNEIKPAARSHELEQLKGVLDVLAADEARVAFERGCWNCGNHLGGGSCRMNLEADCGEGGYEAWEPDGNPNPIIAEV